MSSQPTLVPLPPSPFVGRLLFYKVLALVLVTAVISVAAVGVYLHYMVRDARADFLTEQLDGYVDLIVDDVGMPADTSIARSFSRSYPVDIRIEGPAYTWSSDTSMTSFEQLQQALAGHSATPESSRIERSGRFDDHFHGITQIDSWRYVVRLRSPITGQMPLLAVLLLCAVLLVLLVIAYFAVERFLKPLNELMEGVQEVGSGNFEHRVPITSKDELGELTRAFNRMARQISDILASKRRLLFDVSHELRSPLTRMNVALTMLPESKARTSIERNVRELNVMITELLENERLAVLGGNLVVEEFDLVELATHVVESFADDADRIEFDSLTDSLVVTADSQRITVALRNLISNALKYSADCNEPVKVTVFPDDDGARVVVADKGIGIPPEAQEHVFDPFYRTDDSRSRATGGYGLGLSLTKSIVEAHGGTIRLNSTPGMGTTVMIWFPRIPDPDAIARRIQAHSQKEPQSDDQTSASNNPRVAQ
jgi:signal transduction histidine kinase